MSIVAYLSAGIGKPELRMPKGADELGTRFEGAVLEGEKTVDQRLRDDAVRSVITGDEYYAGGED